MLVFATEFSVDAERTTSDFLLAMVTWISGSPHTRLSADRLQELRQKDEASVQSGNERVQSLVSSSTDVDLAGIRYTRYDDDFEWQTGYLRKQRIDVFDDVVGTIMGRDDN